MFLVALPLCLGIALASRPNNAALPDLTVPLFAGVLSGIIGGIVVGALSGSHTSVSGPAAGLTAVIAAQLVSVGSFEGLLLAVLLAGVIQIGMGIARTGSIWALGTFSVSAWPGISSVPGFWEAWNTVVPRPDPGWCWCLGIRAAER